MENLDPVIVEVQKTSTGDEDGVFVAAINNGGIPIINNATSFVGPDPVVSDIEAGANGDVVAEESLSLTIAGIEDVTDDGEKRVCCSCTCSFSGAIDENPIENPAIVVAEEGPHASRAELVAIRGQVASSAVTIANLNNSLTAVQGELSGHEILLERTAYHEFLK
ncbi:hypothetical protein ACLOJK_009511 [Asimina triloba]